MAISLGATKSSSGNNTNSAGFSFSHTTDANTKCLVVVVTGYDSSNSDLVVSTVAFNTTEGLTKRKEYISASGYGMISVWSLYTPTITTANIVVTPQGKCTDIQATAVNLTSTNIVWYDSSDDGTGSGSASAVISPARAGSVAVGGGVAEGGTAGDLSITAGTEVSGSEVDMGGETASVGTASASGTTATLTWAYSGVAVYAAGATFYEQVPPDDVLLEFPIGNEIVSDLTPALLFTGTDTNSDDVTYQLQIDTASTFDSQSGSPLIDALSASGDYATAFTRTGDSDPFTSGEQVTFTVPAEDALTAYTKYYWRARAKDPSGTNTFGSWSIGGGSGYTSFTVFPATCLLDQSCYLYWLGWESFPRDEGQTEKLGQCFVPEQNGKICNIRVVLEEFGSPTGDIYLKIYSSTTGDPAYEQVPDELLGTSDVVYDASTLSGTTIIDFTFSDGPVVASGTKYFFTLESTGELSDTDFITVVCSDYYDEETPDGYENGYSVYYNGGTWYSLAIEILFYPLDIYFMQYYSPQAPPSAIKTIRNITTNSLFWGS